VVSRLLRLLVRLAFRSDSSLASSHVRPGVASRVRFPPRVHSGTIRFARKLDLI